MFLHPFDFVVSQYYFIVLVSFSGQLSLVNGYRSNSHSPCDTAANSKESLGSVQSCDDEDNIEDDDNRSEGDERENSLEAQPPGSPVAPLSLTTHRNNDGSRNSSPVSSEKKKKWKEKRNNRNNHV